MRLDETSWRFRFIAGVSTVIVFVLFLLNWPIRVFSLTRKAGLRIESVLGKIWGIALVRAAGLRVNVCGERSFGNGPFVIVANHTLILDIPVLLVALGNLNFRFLAAAKIFRIKVLGGAMRFAGHIPFDRDNPRAMAETYKSLNERCFRHGQSVAVFPEGTRSPEVTEFGDSVFTRAIRDGVPILPVRLWLSSGSKDADVLIGQRILTENMNRSEGKRLSQEIRDWMINTPRPV